MMVLKDVPQASGFLRHYQVVKKAKVIFIIVLRCYWIFLLYKVTLQSYSCYSCLPLVQKHWWVKGLGHHTNTDSGAELYK